MSYVNTFKRFEMKYLITKEQYRLLINTMNGHMLRDEFGKYTIGNIYFDTPDNRLVRKSIEKPIYKEKLRVRSYGVAKSYSTVFIEMKKKYEGIVYKRRIDVEEKKAMEYLCNRIPLENQTQITREIDYFYRYYKNIVPAMFISYEREAFYCPVDSNLRVTFDENILFRDFDLSLTKGMYGNPILSKNMVLLEVKTVLGLPLWLTEFLSKNKIYKTSFSKYSRAYELINLTETLGGKKYVA